MIRAASALFLLATPAFAGDVEITDAKARALGNAWSFDVTLLHADTGWEHYADAWRVVAPDGTVLGTRTLLHPHVNEQPFTRSLSGVEIPAGTAEVFIEAHDSVHGWAPDRFRIALPE